MRTSVLLGSVAAAAAVAVVAVIGLRGIAPPPRPAPQASGTPSSAGHPPAAAATAAGPALKPGAAPAAQSNTPSFDVVTVDPQGHAVIAGRAGPGDKVRVLDGDKPIGEVTADNLGEWVLVPEAPIAPGSRQLALEATGPNGGPPRRSGDVVALSVNPPASPGGPTSSLAVLLPGDAGRPARVLQQPTAPEAQPGPTLALDTAEYGSGNRLALSGHADPGARLAIYGADKLLGTATADADGKWTLVAPEPRAVGGFELRLDQFAADGSVVKRIAASIEAPNPPKQAAPGTYIVRHGDSLWLIARSVYGEGTRYTAIFSANRGQIRDPDQIFPGQLFKVPKS